jgi:hypothetical protein
MESVYVSVESGYRGRSSGLWAFAIPAILEGINWLFWGSAAAGGAVLATSGIQKNQKMKLRV